MAESTDQTVVSGTESQYAASGNDDRDPKTIIEEARRHLKECIDEESQERHKMLDDLRFCTLDQWPEDIRSARENDIENGPRPCLTLDKINQYVTQIVNDLRQGKPGINVRPQDDHADVETAKVLKGIIRNIEDQSNADVAYAVAAESAVRIGVGYFRITTEYADAESFDQEIRIRSIPNTFSVYLCKHALPDGSDCERGFIIESMPVEKFKQEFPKAKYARDDFDELQEQIQYWHTGEMVTVVEEYCIKKHMQMLYYLADGTTMTKADYDKWPEEAAGPKPQVTDRRMAVQKQLYWAKMTGVEVLDKRKLPGQYIPIVEVVGKESHVDGKRILWGVVRPAKDALRMYNYWASTITEKMALAPKTPFIGAKGQFEGMEDRWKKANIINYAYLEYNPIDVNGNAIPPPQRVGPTPMEAALLQQMQVIEHDVQTSLGMFKAAVGETESQQSGRAILALQRESDTGTYHFGANQAISIRHAGRIIVDLIPHYYDTKRVVRIIGDDGEVQSAQLDPELETPHQMIQNADGAGSVKNIYNPTIGKYDIAITVGPSYNTKRMEAAATFVEMAKGSADPASAAVLRYLVMRNSDSAGADEAAKLLKTLLPPQALQALDSNDPIPPKVLMQMQQMQAQVQAMQEAGQKLQQENQQLKAGVAQAQIKAQSDERIAQVEVSAEAQLEKMRQMMEAQAAEMQRQAEEREARREAEFERWKALLEAATKVDVAQIQARSAERAAANRPQPQ